MAVAYASVSGLTMSSGTSAVLNKPSGTVEGDLLIFVGCWSGGATLTSPAGWTQITGVAGAYIFWKVAGPSEGSTYTFTKSSGSGNCVFQIARLTGAHPTAPIEATSSVFQGTNNGVLPTLTVTDGKFLWQTMCGILTGGTFTPPGTATESFDQAANPATWPIAGGYEVVTAGATGTRTWVLSGVGGTKAGAMFSIVEKPPPVNHTVSPTDAEGLTDSSAVAQTHSHLKTDAEGLTDTTVLQSTMPVLPTDNEGLTDSAQVTLSVGHKVTQTDALGTTDTATVQQQHTVTSTDALGTTDTASVVQVLGSTVTDVAALTDAVTIALSSDHQQVEVVVIEDSVVAVQDHVSTTGDELGVTDSALFAMTTPVVGTDNAGLTDSTVVEVFKLIPVQQADTLGLSDEVAFVTGQAVNWQDIFGITDEVDVLLRSPIKEFPEDLAGLTDEHQIVQTATHTSLELMGLADLAVISIYRMAVLPTVQMQPNLATSSVAKSQATSSIEPSRTTVVMRKAGE